MRIRTGRRQDSTHRQVLEAKQAQLIADLRRREGIEIETAADMIDTQQQATERELAILNLERDSMLLRNVRAALQRLEEGSFGVCAACEEEISPRRLAAVPWTSYCLKCQEEMDLGFSTRLDESLAGIS